MEEYNAEITVRRQGSFQMDTPQGLHGKSDHRILLLLLCATHDHNAIRQSFESLNIIEYYKYYFFFVMSVNRTSQKFEHIHRFFFILTAFYIVEQH